jgi:hypothetical protein
MSLLSPYRATAAADSGPALPSAPPERRVSWTPVLVLAVVLAYADGFWLISLRGAVGAIERTQSPFASWLEGSTAVLPVFVVAVLGALMVASRLFGPATRGARQLLATAALVVGAGTVAGVAAIAASSAYDYHLQTAQLRVMDAMHAICTDSCLAQQQHATLLVHMHGVVYVGRWLLLTNVVLVGWLLTVWGGRLRLFVTRPARAVSVATRATDLRMLLVGALVAAAAVHAAVVPEHLTEWPAAGMFFLLLTIWELAVAGLLLARVEERLVLVAVAVVSIGPLLLWLWSRTVGMPFGPEPGQPEAVGLPDLLACALELGALAAAVALLRTPRWLRERPRASAPGRALSVMALIAVATVAVTTTGLSWLDAFGASGSAVIHMTH